MKKYTIRFIPFILILFLAISWRVSAQNNATLDVISTDLDNLPQVRLNIQARNNLGQVIDLQGRTPSITQNGTPANVQAISEEITNPTFIIFLIDITESAAESAEAIQQAIRTYASASYMKEGTDYTKLYGFRE